MSEKIIKYKQILDLVASAYTVAKPLAESLAEVLRQAYRDVRESMQSDPDVSEAEFEAAVSEFQRATSIEDPLGADPPADDEL